VIDFSAPPRASIAELKQLKIDIVNCTCGRTKASARGR
jgi:hypothetical protein